jgi:hypothetical protein
MADANIGMQVFTYNIIFQFGYLSFFLIDLQACAVLQSHAGTIITTVF